MFDKTKRLFRAIAIHRMRRRRDRHIADEYEAMLDGVAACCRRAAHEHLDFVRTLPLDMVFRNTTFRSMMQRMDVPKGTRFATADQALDFMDAEYLLAMMQKRYRDAAFCATKCIAAWSMYASYSASLYQKERERLDRMKEAQK